MRKIAIFSLSHVNAELDVLLHFSIVHSENENLLYIRKHTDAAESCDSCVVSHHSLSAKNKKKNITHTQCVSFW